LEDHELFLYLREVRVKYWNNPIVIEKERCIEKLLKHLLFTIVEVYWEIKNC